MTDLQKNARILIVDDEPGNIELLAALFEEQYEVLFAVNGEKALELAARYRPDCILLDLIMPGMSGFEVCSRLKFERQTAELPIVFITGQGDAETETRGLELGASDFVTKPINPLAVKIRVNNQIELKRAREQLVRRATSDGLTGLANRRHFDETLDREYGRHIRSQAPLSLILLDIDYFKPFNDTYGHPAGDECLRRIARVLDAVVHRSADLVARYGGEEFVCILPETDLDGAAVVAEKIRSSIAELAIPHAGSTVTGYVTASFGVCSMLCNVEKSALNLLARADEQLYAAKKAGRNRVMTDGVR